MLTVTELARQLGVARQTVYNRCKAAGLCLDDYVVAQDGNNKLLSAEGAEAIRRAVRPHDFPAIEEPARQPDPDPAAADGNIIEETPEPEADPDPGTDAAAMQAAQDEISRQAEKIQLLNEQISDLRQQLRSAEDRERKLNAQAAEREKTLQAQINSLTVSIQAATVTAAQLAAERGKQAEKIGIMARIRRLFSGSASEQQPADRAGAAADDKEK